MCTSLFFNHNWLCAHSPGVDPLFSTYKYTFTLIHTHTRKHTLPHSQTHSLTQLTNTLSLMHTSITYVNTQVYKLEPFRPTTFTHSNRPHLHSHTHIIELIDCACSPCAMWTNTLSHSLIHDSHAHMCIRRLLETNVESLRVDVVDRRCRVSEREVDELTKQVNAISRTVRQLEGK